MVRDLGSKHEVIALKLSIIIVIHKKVEANLKQYISTPHQYWRIYVIITHTLPTCNIHKLFEDLIKI